MFFTIVEFAVDSGIWTLVKAYRVGRWMVYGTEEDPREQYIREQKEIIEAYKNQLDTTYSELAALKDYVHVHAPELDTVVDGVVNNVEKSEMINGVLSSEGIKDTPSKPLSVAIDIN